MNFKNMKYLLILFCLVTFISLNIVNAEITDYDIINLSASSFNYNPTPANIGGVFELWIQLTNNSNIAATNVKYLLDLDYPFSISDFNNDIRTINKIAPHQTVIIKYKIKVDEYASDGTHNIKFKFKRDGVSSYTVQEYDIDISGDQALVDVISSNVNPTNIGGETNVDLTIKNLGEKNAKNIFVTIDDSSDSTVKIIGLKTIYIPKLSINEEKNVNFKVSVSDNATDKTYSLPITIEYSDIDSNYSTNRDIGIEIIDNPKIIINTVSIGKNKSGSLLSNENEKIELEIYNIGNIDAESVYIDLNGPISDNFNKYFIGSIEKDNYDSATLEFKTNNLKPKIYPLTINVHYKDSKLQDKIKTETINVSITNNSKKHSFILSTLFGILYFILFVVGITILIIILKWIFKKIIKPTYSGLFKKILKK